VRGQQVYSPTLGAAECLTRTLLEWICTFSHESNLPKSLWGEVLRHAVWLKNHAAPLALDGKAPFKALLGQPPDLLGLRV